MLRGRRVGWGGGSYLISLNWKRGSKFATSFEGGGCVCGTKVADFCDVYYGNTG